MLNRLIANWVYGGFLAGVLLLLLAPLLVRSWPPALIVAFLCLPIYMLHQYEEHDNDRFRRFVNQTVGHGKEVLSREAVFIINVPGVWGVIGLALALAATVNPGFALIAVYLVLVNAVAHIGQAVAMHRYNAGLGTAIGLFLPLGIFGLTAVQQAGSGTVSMHLIGFLVALGIHAAIIVHVKRRSLFTGSA